MKIVSGNDIQTILIFTIMHDQIDSTYPIDSTQVVDLINIWSYGEEYQIFDSSESLTILYTFIVSKNQYFVP